MAEMLEEKKWIMEVEVNGKNEGGTYESGS